MKPESHGAILVVATGTTRKEGRAVVEKCMSRMQMLYPHAEVSFAFTSEAVRRVLKEDGEEVFGPLAAITRLLDAGHAQVVVQPLCLVPGAGYHELYQLIASLNELAGAHGVGRFDGVLISRPLLMNPEDYTEAAEVITALSRRILAEGEALVLVSPGSEGGADPALCQMQMVLDDCVPSGRIVIGAVGGYPGIQRTLSRLEHIGVKSVRLVPFALVAGIHEWMEISGETNPESWKTVLESNGYAVTVEEKAFGEFDEVLAVFPGRLQETAGTHGFLK